MKKVITYIILLFALTSCWYKIYPGQPDKTQSDLRAAMVEISVGAYGELPSKGSGAIDDKDDMIWKDNRIYIYGFHQNADSYVPTSSQGDFEDEVPMVCVVDGSRDAAREGRGETKAGKRAKFAEDNYIDWDAEEDFRLKYPGGVPFGLERYDFYAYYIDDYPLAEEAISRTNDSISFPVEIDGARDYMTAQTRLTDAHLRDMGFTIVERDDMKQNAYSSYTANRNVHPQLYFSHHLARVDFEVYPGGPPCDGIYLQKIELKGRTRAEMTVVHKDRSRIGLHIPQDGPYEFIALREANGKDSLKKDTYMLQWKEEYDIVDKYKDVYERDKIVMGGSLIMSPEDEYEWKITLKGSLADGEVIEREIIPNKNLTLDNGEKFVAGNKYLVRLAVYALDDIRISVTALAWGDGGGYEYDPDA